VIVARALISAAGLCWLSRIPADGSYLASILPGMLVISIGFGPVFVGVTTAANAGVPADKGRTGGIAAQRLPAARRRVRTGDLLRPGHRPHPPSAGGAHTGGACAHGRLPASAAGGEPVHPGVGVRRSPATNTRGEAPQTAPRARAVELGGVG
jgi:hypothetical protein